MSQQIVVKDSCVLINLINAGLFDSVVRGLGLEVHTTDLVAAEMRKGDQREDWERIVKSEVVKLSDGLKWMDEDAFFEEYQRDFKGLSIADVSVLHLAQSLGAPLYTSDSLLRKCATGKNVVVRGEFYIMDGLVDSGIVSKVEMLVKLQKMIDMGARFPKDEVEKRRRDWQ